MICQNLVEELEEAYTLITVVEEEMVENAKKLDLSLAEVHMLQAIGKNKEKGRTISELAAERYITLSSVTIAVNKLARKGYVLKTKAQRDGRVVYARLTEQGERWTVSTAGFTKASPTTWWRAFRKRKNRCC